MKQINNVKFVKNSLITARSAIIKPHAFNAIKNINYIQQEIKPYAYLFAIQTNFLIEQIWLVQIVAW